MQNKDFLQTLYDGTRHLGLVKSQYEFGYICGKKKSWLSCAKSVDRAMPLDAMVILAVSLENMIPARLPKSRQSEAKKLVRGLWDIIRAKAETHITQLKSQHKADLTVCNNNNAQLKGIRLKDSIF